MAAADDITLRVGDREVATYHLGADLEPTLSPRPYLHPVRTLGGSTVTDVAPEDHRWHLGVSLTMQDVNGTNLWGGRTYVRDVGYTWREDHGRIEHDTFTHRAQDRFVQQLRWCDPAGETLLSEERSVTAGQVPGRDDGWLLDLRFTLTAPPDRAVPLGSPATNGRPDGAGYGGYFWRLAPGDHETFTAEQAGEAQVNGSTAPWLAVTAESYTLVFSGLAPGDHWFVRTGMYPGVCAALAWEKPLTVPAGGTVRRHYPVIVVDGSLSRAEVAALVAVGCSAR